MAPSQLKQLKASLREGGLTGPQQPKKQKKKAAQSGRDPAKLAKRKAALQGIRERFNPFESKILSRPTKFEVTSRDSINGAPSKAVRGRPGVTKGLGEERRRQTLLKEIHSRNKVGGVLDRRFGENDPTMTPDERAAERFARESQRRSKKGSMFNLEEDEGELELTHLGRSLTFDREDGKDKQEAEEEEGLRDDFDGLLDNDNNSEDEHRKRKRRRLSPRVEDENAENGAEDGPERMKTKNEVMKEVIAKSKLYKYERQKAKEDDDDLRAELDSGLAEIYELIGGRKSAFISPPRKPEPSMQMNPDREALLNGKERKEADREYDERLRQMTFDKRSKPSERTKTEEEKAEEEAERLRTLEANRLRRMRGESESDSDVDRGPDQLDIDQESINDDAKAFGLAMPSEDSGPKFGVEDEDDFILDDDLIASDPDADHVLGDEESASNEDPADDDDDAEFLGDLSLPDVGDNQFKDRSSTIHQVGLDSGLAFTYPCPQSHEELLQIITKLPMATLPTVVQRIRALYHPKLNSENKFKMAVFATVLIEHIAYLANQTSRPSFGVLESLMRHIHSLAKTYPESVGRAFRSQLKTAGDERPLNLSPGDLIILTGVGFIFPTSDHFHEVATPSMLTITRYLGQSIVRSLNDLASGAYLCSLSLQYQSISRRYVPEIMNYVLNALEILAPVQPRNRIGHAPRREVSKMLGISGEIPQTVRALSFWDILDQDRSKLDEDLVKGALVENFAGLLDAAANLWRDKSAFYEMFAPAMVMLKHYLIKPLVEKLPKTTQQFLRSVLKNIEDLLAYAALHRRPLRLHNHRPLAIKTSIPKFEESFNPDRHYDPDRDRAELSKLKAEHKREHKGAMRELRKDANFIARESLKEKKAKDAEYEKKYRRLVSDINAEEGREANNYEREKTMRKRKK